MTRFTEVGLEISISLAAAIVVCGYLFGAPL